MNSEQRQRRFLAAFSAVGVLLIIGMWTLSAFLLYNDDDRGTFGDMFGAVNALFSGLAFLGLILAIILQYQELKEQRREIRDSRIAQQATATALQSQLKAAEFRAKVESLNTLIDAQEGILGRLKNARTVPGKDALSRAENELTRYTDLLRNLLEREIKKIEDDLPDRYKEI